MALQTYRDLKEAVQAFMVRNDPKTVDQIPTFIHLAETECYKLVDLPFSEGLLITSGAAPALPKDIIGVKSIIVDKQPHSRLTPEAFFRLSPYSEGRYFTIHDGLVEFHPATDDQSEIVIHYKKRAAHLSQDADSNELLETAPDLLLYVSLKHGCSFIRDRDQSAFWDDKANEAATTLKNSLDDFWFELAPVVPQP